MCKQNINGLQPIIISTLYYESFFFSRTHFEIHNVTDEKNHGVKIFCQCCKQTVVFDLSI